MTASIASEGYGDDLAYIHDAGFSGFALGAAPGLLGILRRGGISGGLVVDLGCGSGIWARELALSGYDVLGIDLSAPMVELARHRVPSARFEAASFLDAAIPPCDAVTAIGEVFNYLSDARNGDRGLRRVFRRVFEALRPGGLFVFDVARPGKVRGPGPRRAHREGEDWAILYEIEEDPKRSLLTRRMTTFRKVGDLYRRGEAVHTQRLYKGAGIASCLRREGFRVRLLRGYGTFRFPDAHAGFLARKT